MGDIPDWDLDDIDLRAYGYAPGWYMFKCCDCPEPKRMLDWAMGAKRSWRCRDHAFALFVDKRNIPAG